MVQEDNVVSAKVLRLEQVGKFEDLEYCLYSRQSMVGGEVKVQVRGKIMGLFFFFFVGINFFLIFKYKK